MNRPSVERPARGGWKRFTGPALILLVAVIATSPQFFQGNSCGHDFNFHLVSWLDAQQSWRHGLFYPHWAPSPNFRAGEARFVFYPPLTWMLGAALGLFLAWKPVPIVLTILLLTATGLATRKLAQQVLQDGPATLAGCAALFSGYSLFTAYERSAFGELAGGFWIPCLLLLILRDRNPSEVLFRRAFDGSALPLALVVAGAWLSNAPLGVMASYLLAGVALTAAVQLRSWAPILRASVASAIGLGLSAFYLVPAAVEQRWVEIRQATDDPGLLIENSWLFARHAGEAMELHDVELLRVSAIAVTMIALTLAGVFFSWRRGRFATQRAWWLSLAVIPVVVLLLQFPISLPLWNALPKLRFLQFPWRWLVVLEAPMGIFFAAAVWTSRRRLRIAMTVVYAIFLVGITMFTAEVFFQHCDSEDSVRGSLRAYRDGLGFAGTDEYAPPGADDSLVATDLPDACFTTNPVVVLGRGEDGTTPAWSQEQGTCEATFQATANGVKAPAEHVRIAAVAPQAGFLILRLRTYPAWKISVNGQPAASQPRREDGLIVVPVPQGSVKLTVDWTTTSDVKIGRLVSLLSAVLLFCLGLLERRLRRHAGGSGTPQEALRPRLL